MEFKLLVVDDERKVTELLSEFFRSLGYQLVLAGSGDEAVAILDREPVDLVILDLHMPGLPGEEVIRHVKKKIPKTKIVVVTAYPDREASARAAGCDGFLTKPLAIGDLFQAAETLLSQKEGDEIREGVIGFRAARANPGDPMAQLLFLEPYSALSNELERFFSDPSRSGGIYQVHIAESLPKALAGLVGFRADIVLLNLHALTHPAQAARAFLDCKVQPKDYIFYLKPQQLKDEELLAALPAKRWNGDPFNESDLWTLAKLVESVAREHTLIKR